jgi:hypothetical protein
MDKPGKRHPLLIYRRLFGSWRFAALLIALGGGALAIFQPGFFGTTLGFIAALALAGVGGLLFIYTLIAPTMSYVQCHPTHIVIGVPLYQLNISYARLRTVRPYKVASADVPKPQIAVIEPYLGQSAVALELLSYPIGEKTLRWFVHTTMFPKEFRGFILITPDWMALSNEIDSYRSNFKSGGPRQAVSAASAILMRGRK